MVSVPYILVICLTMFSIHTPTGRADWRSSWKAVTRMPSRVHTLLSCPSFWVKSISASPGVTQKSIFNTAAYVIQYYILCSRHFKKECKNLDSSLRIIKFLLHQCVDYYLQFLFFTYNTILVY